MQDALSSGGRGQECPELHKTPHQFLSVAPSMILSGLHTIHPTFLLLPHECIEKHFLFGHLWGSREPHNATLRGKNTLMTAPALFPVSKNISDQPPNPGTFKPSSGTRRFRPTQRHLASCDSSKMPTPLTDVLFWFFSTPGIREQDHRSIETSVQGMMKVSQGRYQAWLMACQVFGV